MNDIGGRIRSRRKALKLTQSQLAAKIGTSDQSVSDWEKGRTLPMASIVTLSRALGVTIDWLLTGEAIGLNSDVLTYEKLTKAPDFERAEMPHMHQLPVVNKIAADHQPTFAEAKDTELVNIKYSKKDHYCLVVKGRSMFPTIMEGDRVVVHSVFIWLDEYDEMKGPADKRGWLKMHEEVVCAIVNDEYPVLKRLFVYDIGVKGLGFEMYLQSDNRKVQPIIIRNDTSLKIIGVVQEIMRNPRNYE